MKPPQAVSEFRVLIAAENASVRFGGEAILPWHYFRLLRARGIDTHLVVHERCRAELVQLAPAERDRLHFVHDQTLQKLFFKLGRCLPRRLDEASFGFANQMLTQFAQRAVLRRLASETSRPCVLHQPIPVSPRTPSLLGGLGMPLVVGPLNGGMEYPPAFRQQESLPSRWAIAFARSLTDLFNRLMPGKREAAVVLVANRRTQSALPGGLRGRILELAENAVDLTVWTPSNSTPEPILRGGRQRFVFIGRLVDWKALDLAIEAIARVEAATLDILGDGPMRDTWQQTARRLGVADRVTFHGWKTQPECAGLLLHATALVLPSLFECGGAVVLEAMATSRPVIATAWGGPLDYLDDTCGMLVAPGSREALIAGFAEAMRRLVDSAELCARMGAAGRARLERHFDWNSKIDAMLEIYRSTL